MPLYVGTASAPLAVPLRSKQLAWFNIELEPRPNWFYRRGSCFLCWSRASDLIQNYVRIDLVKSSILYIGKRKDAGSSGLIPNNGSDHTNIDLLYFKARIQSLTQHEGSIPTLLNRISHSLMTSCSHLTIWLQSFIVFEQCKLGLTYVASDIWETAKGVKTL